MTERKEGLDLVQILCIVAGVGISLSVMNYWLGYSGVLPSALAGGIGAVGGTLVGELIKRFRN